MERFPFFQGNIPQWIIEVIRAQDGNAAEADNYKNIYQRGRRTFRIPSGPTDVIAGDRLWDVTNDGTYRYELLDLGGGVLKWDIKVIDVVW
jgi:hypothetical protein